MALTKSLSFSLGRKRVLISNNSCNMEQFCADFESFSPVKRFCSDNYENHNVITNNEDFSSVLEALPQELLIKVICGVNHDDLKQLYLVSKTVYDAAKIAKKSHFAYSTPSKIKAFRNSIDDIMDFEEIEAPKAPKQARKLNRSRICKKKLDDISVALFSNEEDDDEEEQKRWPRRSLFMEIDS